MGGRGNGSGEQRKQNSLDVMQDVCDRALWIRCMLTATFVWVWKVCGKNTPLNLTLSARKKDRKKEKKQRKGKRRECLNVHKVMPEGQPLPRAVCRTDTAWHQTPDGRGRGKANSLTQSFPSCRLCPVATSVIWDWLLASGCVTEVFLRAEVQLDKHRFWFVHFLSPHCWVTPFAKTFSKFQGSLGETRTCYKRKNVERLPAVCRVSFGWSCLDTLATSLTLQGLDVDCLEFGGGSSTWRHFRSRRTHPQHDWWSWWRPEFALCAPTSSPFQEMQDIWGRGRWGWEYTDMGSGQPAVSTCKGSCNPRHLDPRDFWRVFYPQSFIPVAPCSKFQ